MSAGIALHEVDLPLLLACDEANLRSKEGAYKYMHKHALIKKDFEKFVKLKRQDDDQQIPIITLDGKAIGYPGYYLMKVPVMDELHAARAACLGKLTDCCQSFSGESGEPCVIHGLTSPYVGFYVVCQGDVMNPKVEDTVLGQCWAWRSQKDAIVFDSIEIGRREPIVLSLFKELAKRLIKQGHTHKVACGKSLKGSYIGTEDLPNEKEQFKDYSKHSDYKIPYLLYSQGLDFYDNYFEPKKESSKHLTACIQAEGPLIQNYFLCSLLHSIMQGNPNKDSKKQRKLLSEIIEISKKSGRLTEACELIDMPLDRNGNTLLHKAVKNLSISGSDKELPSKLLEAGANVNAVNQMGETAVYLEIGGSDTSYNCLKFLLENGANPDISTTYGDTPIHRAAKYGYYNCMELLLKHCANVNQTKGYYGDTPLHQVARNQCDGNLVTLLLKYGADPTLTDKEGQTPLEVAVKNRKKEIAQVIYKAMLLKEPNTPKPFESRRSENLAYSQRRANIGFFELYPEDDKTFSHDTNNSFDRFSGGRFHF